MTQQRPGDGLAHRIEHGLDLEGSEPVHEIADGALLRILSEVCAHDDVPGMRKALADALRQRVNGLDASGAQAAWQQLDAGLSRLLPAFLRQPQPLQMADVTAGLAAMRPSTRSSPSL